MAFSAEATAHEGKQPVPNPALIWKDHRNEFRGKGALRMSMESHSRAARKGRRSRLHSRGDSRQNLLHKLI